MATFAQDDRSVNLVRLYRALSFFPELPSAAELASHLGWPVSAAEAALASVDAFPQTSRLVDECIRRLRNSADSGEADVDQCLDPNAVILPIKESWPGEDGAPEWVVPKGMPLSSRRILFLHGGGYESYSPSDPYRPLTTRLAAVTGLPVLALDYRLMPAHPFPSPLRDALFALDWIWSHGPPIENVGAATHPPTAEFSTAPADAVYVVGDSAGGGLALCLIAAIALKELAPGVPLPIHPPPPTALALLSPWNDLTASLDSYHTRRWAPKTSRGDPVFSDGDPTSEIAASVECASRIFNCPATLLPDPRISPIFLSRPLLRAFLPPTLLLVGDAEVMLCDSTELAARALEAGVPCDRIRLKVYRRMWHVFPMYSEACGQQGQPLTAARRTTTTAPNEAAAGQTGPSGGSAHALSRTGGLPQAWHALEEISTFIAQTPPPSRHPAHASLGPLFLCLLPVIASEAVVSGHEGGHGLGHLLCALAMSGSICLNSVVRLCWPSSYCPRRQAHPGLLASPLVARTLATVAELAFYAEEARALGLPFWPAAPLAVLTYLGEALCWGHVLLQSELLGCLEDTTWTGYQLVALLSSTNPLRFVVCLPYVLNATGGGHLRRQFSRVRAPYFGEKPFWQCDPAVGVPPDAGVLAWSVPSLLVKPVTYALLRLASHGGVSEGLLWGGVLPGLTTLLLAALWWEQQGAREKKQHDV